MAQPAPLNPNNLVVGSGQINSSPTVAQIEAVQTSGTHVGTVTADFSFAYAPTPATPTVVLKYAQNQIVTADATLYAALGAISAPITWAD